MEKNDNQKSDLDGRFILIDRKGKGATATVYLVEDSNGNKYAAKILIEPSQYFQKEIEMLKIVKSPYIANLIEAGEGLLRKKGKVYPKKQFLILDYAEKGELFDYIFLPQQGLGEKYGKLVFLKILEGVNACHKVGVCHRDLKMENILLDNQFNPKLSDFGFSTLISGENGNNILSSALGTLSYSCPEIISNKNYNGIKADIFSLGVVLITLVTCKIGFGKASRKDPYYRLIMIKRFDKYWQVVSNQLPNLSNELKDLYLKMVCYDPENRPTIAEIMNHPWFNDIRNLSENEKKLLEAECFDEFLRREKIVKESQQNQLCAENNENENENESFGFKSGNDYEKYFSLKMKPKKYNKTGINMKNYIKLKGKINPIKFMNDMCNCLKSSFEEIQIEPSEKNLNFICIFEKNEEENNEDIDEEDRKELEKLNIEDNEEIEIEELKLKVKLLENSFGEYILKIDKKSGNLVDFYNYVKQIKEKIKLLI